LLDIPDMLISRCAWHEFFRGYPRLLRVVSWRGLGLAFSDTICRSCAERVRIEGLWGSAPPEPVWPGSPQTAALFVGLPLLIALVLMAAPLHDPGPPPPALQASAAPAPEIQPAASVLEPAPPAPAHRRAVHSVRRVVSEPVPAVIFEPRAPRAVVPAADVRGGDARSTVVRLARELARECDCAVSLTTLTPSTRRMAVAPDALSSPQSP
jgi:hypothetical protein